MRKVAGVGILGIALGMFLMFLIRDRLAGLVFIVVLSVAGYFCICD